MNQVEKRLTQAVARPRSARRLRVVLVEDHLILRQGLKALLETDPLVQVVGEAGTVSEALTAIALLNPSVVITDIRLPGQTGVDLIAALEERRSSIPILVLTVLQSDEIVRAAMQAGARGFILKDSPHAELIEGLHAVSAGQKFVCVTLSRGLLRDLTEDVKREGYHPSMRLITPREREVLTRIARGQSSKVAALELGVSLNTVVKHRTNLMRKLKLHNAAAVTMFALRHGLIDGNDAYAGCSLVRDST